MSKSLLTPFPHFQKMCFSFTHYVAGMMKWRKEGKDGKRRKREENKSNFQKAHYFSFCLNGSKINSFLIQVWRNLQRPIRPRPMATRGFLAVNRIFIYMTLWIHKKMSIKLSVMLHASRASILNNVLLYSRKMYEDIYRTQGTPPLLQ